ncbi:MAG TPA: FAD-binding oxidoreductase, partial [Candidatus Polarisedimenticolaceae bacterium]|nr:FAD-binding oxidoreductase [Candidatus Polarisedimenticolaceae bacterium]
LLERAEARGTRRVTGTLDAIELRAGRVHAARVSTAAGALTLETHQLVAAAGPYLARVAALAGVALPVFCERHLKVSFPDRLGAVPRDAPLLIWIDPVSLPGSAPPFPPGVHARPADGGTSVLLWTYDAEPVEVAFPLRHDPRHAELALRGMSKMLPALEPYCTDVPACRVEGGYYTKTRENRPLIGPLPVEGAFVLGALSGFGIMAACGAAELLAAHVTGRALPAHAAAFRLERYADARYQRLLESWGATGQL